MFRCGTWSNSCRLFPADSNHIPRHHTVRYIVLLRGTVPSSSWQESYVTLSPTTIAVDYLYLIIAALWLPIALARIAICICRSEAELCVLLLVGTRRDCQLKYRRFSASELRGEGIWTRARILSICRCFYLGCL